MVDHSERFAEVVVHYLLTSSGLSLRTGFGFLRSWASRRRRRVSMTSVTGVRVCGLPENMGVLIGEIASSTALTPVVPIRFHHHRSRTTEFGVRVAYESLVLMVVSSIFGPLTHYRL